MRLLLIPDDNFPSLDDEGGADPFRPACGDGKIGRLIEVEALLLSREREDDGDLESSLESSLTFLLLFWLPCRSGL